MKTYLKTLRRMFAHHITRLVSIILMVLVSVGFSAGIGMATEKMAYSLSDYYRSANVSDFIVRGAEAIDAEKVEKLRERYGEDSVAQGGVIEVKGGSLDLGMGAMLRLEGEGVGEGITRIYFCGEGTINRAETVQAVPLEGGEGERFFEASAERANRDLKGFPLGKDVILSLSMGPISMDYTIRPTSSVVSPLHMAEYDDPSMTEGEDGEYELLENILYVPVREGKTIPFLPMNEVYVSVPELKKTDLFFTPYERALEREKAEIEEIFSEEIGAETAAVLTLHENFSFESYNGYEGKIQDIGYVLTVVFLLVTLLVVLSTMTRLLEEERGQIACLQTLGYSPARILSKYLLFALVGTLLGAVGAFFASEGLAYIIYINFKWNYVLPPYSSHISPLFFIVSAALILAAAIAATAIAGNGMTRQAPAVLLRPKAPREGRKVILERIPILWNRFSFKYKSTLRNVLRYRTRFAMTVVAVMASTALVLAGLAVLDACLFQDIGTAAMLGVAVIVLVFAALLNAVVIYTLTNINISERKRELATLMVLGYHDNEVTGYVYREIYITSAVGILLGIPLGALLCLFVFEVMGFGALSKMGWYTWLLAPLLSLIFTFLVALILRRKILKTDMNDSLKAIE